LRTPSQTTPRQSAQSWHNSNYQQSPMIPKPHSQKPMIFSSEAPNQTAIATNQPTLPSSPITNPTP
jgi:hypothetical protein